MINKEAAAAPEPEKAQGDAPWTEKELHDWVWNWSQNEGKTPLESDINDLIWTIQKQSGRISSAQEPCQDTPDTHQWSDDYKNFDDGRGQTRYCKKCGLTAVEHTMRIF